ncbi:carbon-nitrogen hydrolase family protein [Nitratiruptor sp. YY09-18]|uniref:carbon-nitrogen hydrolase family protein n=1 Tax=Nitratiruptor sp. YY09-18 TaxID=2724901 RepID=UPI001916AF2F|nr:carbon-nitrogen hydrolase family protein [Nitratiruptor sp. YY09-18]BCD67739.1 nitrilase [Nitratiruptor sp. YY09-18]
MNVALLQTASLALGLNRLDYYLKLSQSKGVRLFVLPEYALNHFFLELVNMPRGMVKQQSSAQLEALRELSSKYDTIIVAPIVRIIKDKIYKSIAIVKKERVQYYNQQILINYPHWNEERFFDNEIAPLQPAPVLRIDRYKIGVLAGFEIHFDFFWQEFLKKDVDAVLVPTAATFASHERWRAVLSSRAFCNNAYVLRINRIGEHTDKDGNIWKFYGDSFVVDPNGNVTIELGSTEELIITAIDKDIVKEAKKSWKFRQALKRRGML